jgi:recombination protein RecT
MSTEKKTELAKRPTTTLPVVLDETTMADRVLSKLSQYQSRREINLPKDYSPQNALKSAWLTILETQDRNKKLATEVCTKESIANALLKMCIQGLSPAKAQCYFVVHGTQLTMMRSYQGTKAVAKRVAGIKDVLPHIIYDGDVFEYALDSATGRQKLIKHEQKFENIIDTKITGAYAIVIEADNSTQLEIMTIAQIRKSWAQGYVGDAHKNFPDQMAKKTVTYRACKGYINSSNDADLFVDGDEDADVIGFTAAEEIKDNANKEPISIDNTPPVEPQRLEKKKEDNPEVGDKEQTEIVF